MKLHLRDLFWLVLVTGLAVGWWIERSKVASSAIPAVFGNAVEFARKNSHVGPHFRLATINQDRQGEFYILFSTGGQVSGGGERWRLKLTDGKWQILEHVVFDA